MLDVGCWLPDALRAACFNQHPKSNIQHPSIMARRRFFVDEPRRGEAELGGEEAEHLTRVLRAEAGQQYEICDGPRLYLGEIVEARQRSVPFRLVAEIPVHELTMQL